MLTDKQLDAIAVKFNLLRRHEYDVPPCRREQAGCHVTTFFGVDNLPRGPLDPTSRHDAMLVLEAMLRENDVRLEGLCDDAYKCTAIPNHRGHEIVEVATPPAAAIFLCAAKLVERM